MSKKAKSIKEQLLLTAEAVATKKNKLLLRKENLALIAHCCCFGRARERSGKVAQPKQAQLRFVFQPCDAAGGDHFELFLVDAFKRGID